MYEHDSKSLRCPWGLREGQHCLALALVCATGPFFTNARIPSENPPEHPPPHHPFCLEV